MLIATSSPVESFAIHRRMIGPSRSARPVGMRSGMRSRASGATAVEKIRFGIGSSIKRRDNRTLKNMVGNLSIEKTDTKIRAFDWIIIDRNSDDATTGSAQRTR